MQDGRDLFPEDKQYVYFHDILPKLLLNNERKYGVCPQDIQTHSVRKGAATYCCAGAHVGSAVITASLRAGWSDGRVKERDLK